MSKAVLMKMGLGVLLLGLVCVAYNVSAGGEKSPVVIADNVLTFAVGDVNGDAYPDIVAGVSDSPLTDNLRLFLNNLNGSFYEVPNAFTVIPQPPQAKAPVIPQMIKLADINGDGLADIIILDNNKRSPHNAVFINAGSGVFVESDTLIDGSFNTTPAIGVAFQDLNNDGNPEIVLLRPDKNIAFSNTAGHFTADDKLAMPAITADKPATTADTDLNKDGVTEKLEIQGTKLVIAEPLPEPKIKSGSSSVKALAASSVSTASLTTAETPVWFYKVTALDGSNTITVEDRDKPIYLNLDATISDYVWGNILLLYESDALECLSVEEDPNNWYGFWTWWTDATAMAQYNGGGDLYFYNAFYDLTHTWLKAGITSDDPNAWYKQWVTWYGQGNAGPVGSVDPNYGATLADKEVLAARLGISTTAVAKLGAIRIYTSTYAGGLYGASPLRLGFKVLSTSQHNFYALADGGPYAPIGYNWNHSHLDSLYTSTFSFILPPPELDLIIYHGQGGSEVSEKDEDRNEPGGGAFTVANLNDTDGDGQQDVGDDVVTPTPTAPAAGRPEVDLMQLKMVVFDLEPNTNPSPIALQVNGPAKIWYKPTKETEMTKRSWSYTDFYLEVVPKLPFYVEITAASGAVRDISLTLTYKNLSDTVLATGVWARVTGRKHDYVEGDPLSGWGDFTDPPLERFQIVYNNFGLLQIPDVEWMASNAIGLQFTVQPRNIDKEPLVKFDIARQAYFLSWIQRTILGRERMLSSGDWIFFPDQDEEANDDHLEYEQGIREPDESPQPTSNRHMYVIDRPRVGNATARYKSEVVKSNFYEFVRVKFGDTPPEGNKIDGSRCSIKQRWQCHHRLIDSDLVDPRNVYIRSTGDNTERPFVNDIRLGHDPNVDATPQPYIPPRRGG